MEHAQISQPLRGGRNKHGISREVHVRDDGTRAHPMFQRALNAAPISANKVARDSGTALNAAHGVPPLRAVRMLAASATNGRFCDVTRSAKRRVRWASCCASSA